MGKDLLEKNFKSLFDYYHDEGGAVEMIKSWAQDSFSKYISEMNKVATTFINHDRGVVNALISGLNNAMAERLKRRAMDIKKKTRI